MTESLQQRLRRALPVLALAAVAFVLGAVLGAHRGQSAASKLATQFVADWSHGRYDAMYEDISPASRRAISSSDFAAAYEEALRTATATGVSVAGGARTLAGGEVSVPMRVSTRLWGRLSLSLTLPMVSVREQPRVRWSRSLAFPGMASGATLSRTTALPRRATLLAGDGSVLAESPADGQARSTPLGEYGTAVVGEIGPIPSSRLAALEAEGVPADADVGISGLELALDDRLRGKPGGALLAGGRVLAYSAPRAAHSLRTTISPSIQKAAVTALGGQLGGVVAMDPASGEILGVAGIGLDGLQPPGSTFKIITVSGALGAHITTPATVYPYATHATLDGVRLENAHGEECGGSLELAFAVSCNSVFSPLGVKLGAARLVATAEAFGFNHPSGVAGAPSSTLPAASDIQGELDIGSTAIGQGEVLATPLQMVTVAAAIADAGRRPTPTFLPDPHEPTTRAVSATVARTVRHLMTEVVREGTGTSAAIPGVVVAGKTGTAELKTAATCPADSEEQSSEHREEREGAPAEGCHGSESEGSNTDAWFTAFAPAIHPRIAVCVLLVKDGAGGETAAPAARGVLEAGLR